MSHTSPGRRILRHTAGAVGALVLLSLGVVPAGAADSGKGLVLGAIGPLSGVKPGTDASLPVTFTNTGTAPLDKVWMTFNVSHGLGYAAVPSNCTYTAGPDAELDSDEPGTASMICEFDQTVAPGVVYAPDRTPVLKVLGNALYDTAIVGVFSSESGSDGDGPPPVTVRGTAPAVKLVERPDATPAAPGSAEHDGWDDLTVKVTARNTADFQVTGARLKGRPGDSVPLSVKFSNAGPAWVFQDMGQPPARVRITMPAGTSVAKPSPYCKNVQALRAAAGRPARVTEAGAGPQP